MKTLSLIVALTSAAVSAAPLGVNYSLCAQKVADGRIVLDGRFDDWPDGGEIYSCYAPDVIDSAHSVRTKAAYDSKGLYLAMKWKTQEAHCNFNDPVNRPADGWRGDAVQLRFWSEPEKGHTKATGGRITHIDVYYSDLVKRSASFVTFGSMANSADLDERGKRLKITNPEGREVKSGWTFAKDGSGYTQETFISWKVLKRSGEPFKEGEDLRLGLQLHWHNPNDRAGSSSHVYCDLINKDLPQSTFFWVKHKAWGRIKFLKEGEVPPPDAVVASSADRQIEKYRTEGVVPIKYNLPRDFNVTIAINDSTGRRVRNLIGGYPRLKGENVDWWDGLDDDGKKVPAGKYTAKMLVHEPYDILYRFQYGSPGEPGWNTADGRGDWLSDHARPVGVASDGEWRYFSHHTSEGGSTVIGIDGDFRKRWGLTRLGGGPLVVDGKYLYMLEGGAHPPLAPTLRGKLFIRKFDARLGREAYFEGGRSAVAVYDYPEEREIPFVRFEGEMNEKNDASAADLATFESWGFAKAGDKFYVSLYFDSKILEIDMKSCKVLAEYKIDKPLGLASDKNGKLLVVSGKTVYKMVSLGKFAPFIEGDLKAPFAICSDSQGNVYATDFMDRMNVRVYDSNGKFLKSIGEKGGRPIFGKYDPNGMYMPVGIACDGEDSLLVAEFDYKPKRYSVWNRKTGGFEREFCGPVWYGSTECNVDTDDPRYAFCSGNVVGLDWEKGEWKVVSTLWRPMKSNAYFGPIGEGYQLTTQKRNGRKYVCASKSKVNLSMAVLNEDLSARPVMHRGLMEEHPRLLSRFVNRVFTCKEDIEYAKKKFPKLFIEGVKHQQQYYHFLKHDFKARRKKLRLNFMWCDLNGDGAVDDNEIEFFSKDEAKGFEFQGNWHAAYDEEFNQYCATIEGVKTNKTLTIWKWPVRRWTKEGVPVYLKEDLKKLTQIKENDNGSISQYALPWGQNIYTLENLVSFDSNGKEMWRYPNRYNSVHGSHAAPKEKNGLLVGTLKGIGWADVSDDITIVAFNSNMGQANLFTTDGLYAGRLLRDNRSAPKPFPLKAERGMSFREMSANGEWFGGEFFRNKSDGKFYLGFAPRNGGGNCQALCEITGLDSLARMDDLQIDITSENLKAIDAFIAANKDAGKEVKEISGEVQTSKATWEYDEKHKASAQLTIQKDSLLIEAEVADSTPFVNRGTDWRYLFKTGDAFLFEYRAEAGNNNNSPIKGDTRILIAPFKDDVICILNRKFAINDEKKHVMEFSSPVRTAKFEVVKILDDLKVKVDRLSASYKLRIEIPFAELGFKPEKGKEHRVDFGVVYGSSAADVNYLRMNWSNRDTGLVNDIPGEADLFPKKWGSWKIK